MAETLPIPRKTLVTLEGDIFVAPVPPTSTGDYEGKTDAEVQAQFMAAARQVGVITPDGKALITATLPPELARKIVNDVAEISAPSDQA